MRLREAQRFYWQELLALQRRVVLVMGNWWAERGQLAAAEHVFGLTWDELMTAKPNRERAAARMKALHRLRTQARQAPAWHYPDFLRGTTPLMSPSSFAQGSQLKARPVSPGIARGPARLIAHPGDFERLRPGDILVTASPDPGWTPIFGTLAGLVTERGGQLSHGAVIAREYGLPAVSGIAGLLGILREGEMLLVDGTEGIVVRLEQGLSKNEEKIKDQSKYKEKI
jgi:pyruvate,water dikinase